MQPISSSPRRFRRPGTAEVRFHFHDEMTAVPRYDGYPVEIDVRLAISDG
jgi:hypothetical protein